MSILTQTCLYCPHITRREDDGMCKERVTGCPNRFIGLYIPFLQLCDTLNQSGSPYMDCFIWSSSFVLPCREAQDLLQKMLKVIPEERIAVADIMRHPFFTTHSKKSKVMSVNQSLLQVPDSMLTGEFKAQQRSKAFLTFIAVPT